MRLTPPAPLTFYFAVLLAVTSVFIEAMALTHVIHVEYAIGGYGVLLLAFLLLFAGNVQFERLR
jgi:hypothetical protein